jgi:DnaJ-class molecular chaperone
MDLIVTYRIHPNPKYQRNGQHIITEHIINIWDLILGSEVPITDLLGNQLSLTVPAGTQPGTVLRMRERGLAHRNGPTGDLLVKIQAQIPKTIAPELLEAIQRNRVN